MDAVAGDGGASGYDVARLNAGLAAPWTAVRYVAETGSTNADLLGDPRGPAGEVLLTDHQTAGRGRLDRRWEEPAGSSVMLSVRLRPEFGVAAWGWIPLLAGVAFVDTLTDLVPADARPRLKWPNDVLLGPHGRKVAGILAEARGEVVVIGAGCNIAQGEAELPVVTATSLALERGLGADPVERTAFVAGLLARFGESLGRLAAAGGDAVAAGLHAAYTARCDTLGRPVRVSRAGGDLSGRAVRIAPDAGLVLETGPGDPPAESTVVAGDVTHVRPAGA